MEWKSGIVAWNRAGTEILCLEQMHGTELEWKYFMWNSCMERKSGTDAWNDNTLELMHGTELERKYASTDAQNIS